MQVRPSFLVLLLLAGTATGVVVLWRQFDVLEKRELVAAKVEERIIRLQRAIDEAHERLIRLQHDTEINLVLARDKMRLVQPGELLWLVEDGTVAVHLPVPRAHRLNWLDRWQQ